MAHSHTHIDADAKLAHDGAKAFVESYYPDLHSNRTNLSRFYSPNANIAWNGNTYKGGDAFAAFFQTMPSTHFEVQSYDAHPVKPNGGILLMTTGYAKFGDERNAPHRGFSESILLMRDPGVPNGFLVDQQSFRLVV